MKTTETTKASAAAAEVRKKAGKKDINMHQRISIGMNQRVWAF